MFAFLAAEPATMPECGRARVFECWDWISLPAQFVFPRNEHKRPGSVLKSRSVIFCATSRRFFSTGFSNTHCFARSSLPSAMITCARFCAGSSRMGNILRSIISSRTRMARHSAQTARSCWTVFLRTSICWRNGSRAHIRTERVSNECFGGRGRRLTTDEHGLTRIKSIRVNPWLKASLITRCLRVHVSRFTHHVSN